MELSIINKNDFIHFVDKKIQSKERKTIGVVRKNSHYVFAELSQAADLQLDYDVTILPPKKFFQPQKEVLLRYIPKQAHSCQAENQCEPVAILGIHYFDLAGIYFMDRVFSDGERDENYLKKRDNSLLVGIFPTAPFKYRFARSVVRDQYYQAADLMLVDMGNEYVIEIVTDKGRQYLQGAQLKNNSYSLREIDEAKNRVRDDQRLPMAVETATKYLQGNYDHPVWKHFGDKCYSCGSCVFVCPTCYCFDVQDELELSLAEGRRVRVWDGCMLEEFARVADGHNFRRTPEARYRHRYFRKAVYLPEKYKYFGCVGCGRCAQACTADIAGPVKVLKYMLEQK